MDAEAVVVRFRSSKESGLAASAVGERLREHGPNVVREDHLRRPRTILLEQFSSAPVALAGLAAMVALATGGLAEALVVAGVVVANGLVGYLSESRAEKSLRSLRRSAKLRAEVIRDGSLLTLPAEAVVPGDFLVLRSGSLVPADGRLLEVQGLQVDESALTGESIPVDKAVAALTAAGLGVADRVNMVYRGTLVIAGSGLAVTTATAHETELGRLQTFLGQVFPPEPAMARELNRAGRHMLAFGGAACGLVAIAALLRGYGPLRLLTASVAAFGAALPEGLATLALSALALGIRNMRMSRLLVTHLRALTNLACIETVCFDKTGTLTRNEMTALRVHAGGRDMTVAASGFTAGEERLDPAGCPELTWLLRVCVLCNDTVIFGEDGQLSLAGTGTERALLRLALRAGLDAVTLREDHPLLATSGRSLDRPIMTTIHRSPHGNSVTAVKGNPAEVLERCTRQLRDGLILPLAEVEKESIQDRNARYASEALRVLGFAYRTQEDGAGDPDPEEPQDLVWLGLVALADPPREGMEALIASLHRAGIETTVITGDQSPTAYAVGRQLNLSGGARLEVLDSTHLTHMDPAALRALVGKVHIYAKVSPTQKLRIIQAYQDSGKVVAMAGDGINDALALRVADVGFAMGRSGADVAREAADVIFQDDNLDDLLVAVRDGRTVRENIRKSLRYLFGTQLGELLLLLGLTAGGMSARLPAVHGLAVNALCLALATEPPAPDVLARRPPLLAEPLLAPRDIEEALFSSAGMAAGALAAGCYGLLRHGPGGRAGGMVVQSLALGQLLHARTCRARRSGGDGERQPNPLFSAAFWGGLALHALAVLVPGFGKALGFPRLGLMDAAVAGGGALLGNALLGGVAPGIPARLPARPRAA
jgi:Ca2+-transporting ATPase